MYPDCFLPRTFHLLNKHFHEYKQVLPDSWKQRKHPSGKYIQASAVNRCAHVLDMSHPLHKAHEKSIKDKDGLPFRRDWFRRTFWRQSSEQIESQEAEVVLYRPTFAKLLVKTFNLCLFPLCNMRILHNTQDHWIRNASVPVKQDPDSSAAVRCHPYWGSHLEVFKAECVCSRAETGLIWFALHFIFPVHAYWIASLTEMSIPYRQTDLWKKWSI